MDAGDGLGGEQGPGPTVYGTGRAASTSSACGAATMSSSKGAGEEITRAENRAMSGWNGHCEIVRSPQDALSAVELVYHRRMEAEAQAAGADTLAERRINLGAGKPPAAEET